ncbi:PREDICTED: uncharacterized protein LOC109226221 [Nicotiana attenuata]|uniref:uncharacterized protein LOC109226221 n=1 Tax=Nicotiana attenuata TaxID=49451 RepID=UPI0009050E6A|nr:PREDICTED: uncharacterized protein LOC109226221 [Nicotiana attenuata]
MRTTHCKNKVLKFSAAFVNATKKIANANTGPLQKRPASQKRQVLRKCESLSSIPASQMVTKSHILAVNAPIRVDVPVGQYGNTNKSRPRLKRGRPIGSKDKNSRKRKGSNDQVDHNVEAIAQEEHKDIIIVEVMQQDEDLEPKSVECRQRNDWPK